ncbi:hypothetical protein [Chitinophaga vietnamensis]|uniref:hypothetical protein n=1 Tax=Chitinophaga vietnamensis TaxID=2593957 RepID=UPI0011777412|nr:hypothetical protein [Chitinophaga vietnamensis]
MKRIMQSLAAIVLLLSVHFAHAQTPQVKLDENMVPCQNLLKQILSKTRQIKDISELYNSVNELKRVGKMYPAEWLPDYYTSLFDMKLALSGKADKKDDLLKEAKEKIDALSKNAGANASEVATLSGYYYYVMIALNPETNGQKYYKDVISNYQKAINLDGKNPRPQLLLAIFQNNMASFMKEKDNNFCANLKKLETAFSEFTPKSEVDPSWGMGELKNAQRTSCAQQ